MHALESADALQWTAAQREQLAATTELMTKDQVLRYNQVRGYASHPH